MPVYQIRIDLYLGKGEFCTIKSKPETAEECLRVAKQFKDHIEKEFCASECRERYAHWHIYRVDFMSEDDLFGWIQITETTETWDHDEEWFYNAYSLNDKENEK